MNEIMPVMTDAAVTILTALLALLAAYCARWINAATAKARAESARIEDDQFRALSDEALARVDDLATKTVTQIEQTAAKTMREAIKGGDKTWTKDDLKELGRLAVNEIISNLSPSYQEVIMETVGDLETYVTNTVESKVYELKNGIAISLPEIKALS